MVFVDMCCGCCKLGVLSNRAYGHILGCVIEMEFQKYPKIKVLGDEENKGILTDGEEVVVEEKVDGGNFRVLLSKGKVILGSRTQQMTSDEGEFTNVQKNFLKCANYVKERVRCQDDTDGVIIYGETMIKHSLSYDWDRTPPFLGFDVFDIKQNKYLGYDEKKAFFDYFYLPMVPLVKRGVWGKDVTDSDLEIPKSAYVENYAEGIVIKNYTRQLFAKKVSDKFKEVNKEVFGQNKKYAKNDSEYFVALFCTNSRIDKWVFKLIDEGNALKMELMHKLPNCVYADIWEEHWKDLMLSNKVIDTRDLKRKVSLRCLAVLKQVIELNAQAQK